VKVTIEKKDEINEYKKEKIQKRRNTKKRKRQKEKRTSVPRPLSWNIYVKKKSRHTNRAGYTLLKNIRDTYTTGSSRLDPGLYGVRVVHICVFLSSCVALPIVCPSMIS
jgi:hypothetical protein